MRCGGVPKLCIIRFMQSIWIATPLKTFYDLIHITKHKAFASLFFCLLRFSFFFKHHHHRHHHQIYHIITISNTIAIITIIVTIFTSIIIITIAIVILWAAWSWSDFSSELLPQISMRSDRATGSSSSLHRYTVSSPKKASSLPLSQLWPKSLTPIS